MRGERGERREGRKATLEPTCGQVIRDICLLVHTRDQIASRAVFSVKGQIGNKREGQLDALNRWKDFVLFDNWW